MSGRWVNVVVLLLFILVGCPAIYLYFTSAGMGYPPTTAGLIAGIPAVVGLILLPFAWKNKV
jgi:hypothetical protein